MLDVSGPTSSFIDEENDPQRNCLSQPKKKKKKIVQLMRGHRGFLEWRRGRMIGDKVRNAS